MLKLTESVSIDASASVVWGYLSKLESIHVWDPAIHRSYCPAQSSRRWSGARVRTRVGYGPRDDHPIGRGPVVHLPG